MERVLQLSPLLRVRGFTSLIIEYYRKSNILIVERLLLLLILSHILPLITSFEF